MEEMTTLPDVHLACGFRTVSQSLEAVRQASLETMRAVDPSIICDLTEVLDLHAVLMRRLVAAQALRAVVLTGDNFSLAFRLKYTHPADARDDMSLAYLAMALPRANRLRIACISDGFAEEMAATQVRRVSLTVVNEVMAPRASGPTGG